MPRRTPGLACAGRRPRGAGVLPMTAAAPFLPVRAGPAAPVPRWEGPRDSALSLAGLVVPAPLFLAIAPRVRPSSRGPEFFVRTLVGLCGRRFGMVRFRSVRVGADAARAPLAGPRAARVPASGNATIRGRRGRVASCSALRSTTCRSFGAF